MESKRSKNINQLITKRLPNNTWVIGSEYKSLKKLNSFNSIANDLNYVKDCIEELYSDIKTKKFNDTVIRSLLFGSITTYVRCFNSRKKDGRLKLEISTIKKYFPKNEKLNTDGMLEFHNYLIKLRNKFIGHADLNEFEIIKSYIEFTYHLKKDILDSQFKVISAGMISFDDIQLNNFKVLTEYMLIVCEIEIKKANTNLRNEIGDLKLKEIGLNITKFI